MTKTPGSRFRQAQLQHKPLQIVGTINAYSALLATHSGFEALYVSGAGVANASYGLPDLGMTTLDNVLTDVGRIAQVVDTPILVDIDTGWGNSFMISRTIKAMERVGAAAVHIEDQVFEKRCGHRPGKNLVSQQEMVGRLKASVDARVDESFVIMARTDALASEGLAKTLERCKAYEEAGADMHFIEAVTNIEDYKRFKQVLKQPILANMTEFGKTHLYTAQELSNYGVDMVLYPLSAFRAMSLAALKVYQEIKTAGTQIQLLDQMQTREELYGFLNYQTYEKQADEMNHQND